MRRSLYNYCGQQRQDHGSTDAGPTQLFRRGNVQGVAAIPDQMPDARQRVIPQAQNTEKHDQIAKPAGHEPVHHFEIARAGRRGKKSPDNQQRRDQHCIAGDARQDRRHGGQLRAIDRQVG